MKRKHRVLVEITLFKPCTQKEAVLEVKERMRFGQWRGNPEFSPAMKVDAKSADRVFGALQRGEGKGEDGTLAALRLERDEADRLLGQTLRELAAAQEVIAQLRGETITVHRSAVDGRFVSPEEAEANPRETYAQTLPGGHVPGDEDDEQ